MTAPKLTGPEESEVAGVESLSTTRGTSKSYGRYSGRMVDSDQDKQIPFSHRPHFAPLGQNVRDRKSCEEGFRAVGKKSSSQDPADTRGRIDAGATIWGQGCHTAVSGGRGRSPA